MTNDEFWRAVGEYLLIQRTRKALNPIDIQRDGGPNYSTVQSIEKGEVGQTRTLELHAAALDLTVPDLFRAVLETAAGNEPPSPELQQIIRKFHSTGVRGRHALVALAQALPDTEPATPPERPNGPQA